MKKSEIKRWLIESDIKVETMSFFVDKNGEDQSDTFMGVCDITGDYAELCGVTALTTYGDIVYLEVDQYLVSGVLGRMAGAI